MTRPMKICIILSGSQPTHLSRVSEELVEVLPRRARPEAEAVLRGVLRAPDGGLAVRGQRHGDLCRGIKQAGDFEEKVHT